MSQEMREATFAILTSLADGPRHGYGIISDVTASSEGRLRLLAGTLYAALERLRTEGTISVSHEEVVQGRLRRSYVLTEVGREALRGEAERRRRSAEHALRRLSSRPGATPAQA